MKSLNDYLTPLAQARWLEIKSNPQHDGFTTKQILSNILARTPATFLLDLSAGQASASATPTAPKPVGITPKPTQPPKTHDANGNPLPPDLIAALAEFGDD
jgi:hypothetical protein